MEFKVEHQIPILGCKTENLRAHFNHSFNRHSFQVQFQSTYISGAVSIDTHFSYSFDTYISGTVSIDTHSSYSFNRHPFQVRFQSTHISVAHTFEVKFRHAYISGTVSTHTHISGTVSIDTHFDCSFNTHISATP